MNPQLRNAATDIAFSLQMILVGMKSPPDGNEDPAIWKAMLDNAQSRLDVFESALAAEALQPFTVLGVRDSDGEVYLNHVEASDEWEALRKTAKAIVPEFAHDLCILGAIAGTHVITPPSEDFGKSAYACDIAADDDA